MDISETGPDSEIGALSSPLHSTNTISTPQIAELRHLKPKIDEVSYQAEIFPIFFFFFLRVEPC